MEKLNGSIVIANRFGDLQRKLRCISWIDVNSAWADNKFADYRGRREKRSQIDRSIGSAWKRFTADDDDDDVEGYSYAAARLKSL